MRGGGNLESRKRERKNTSTMCSLLVGCATAHKSACKSCQTGGLGASLRRVGAQSWGGRRPTFRRSVPQVEDVLLVGCATWSIRVRLLVGCATAHKSACKSRQTGSLGASLRRSGTSLRRVGAQRLGGRCPKSKNVLLVGCAISLVGCATWLKTCAC